MKAASYLLNRFSYLFFGALIVGAVGCYDIYLTPADPPEYTVDKVRIAVLSAPCFREGEALTVYNPYDPDLNYYASAAYRVQWWDLGRGVVQFEGISTPCVCGTTYRVVVTRLEDHASAGTTYTAIDCAAPDDE